MPLPASRWLPKARSLGAFLIKPTPYFCQPLNRLCHFDLSDLLALFIAYIYLVKTVSPIHSYVVSFHVLLLLHYVIPIPKAPNGKLALYRSSRRGQLSIEPSTPFSYWPGQSLPDSR